jgi:signal transduction histidine kinase
MDDKALQELKRSENIANKIRYYDGLMEAYHNYMIVLSKTDHDRVIDYAEKYVSLREKRSVEESRKRIEELQTILDAGNIIKKNEQLKNDLSYSKTLLTIFVLIGILFFFFFVIILLQNRKVKQKEKELTAALDEKNKLFSIVAHDLKNPFSTLLGYTDLILTDFNNYDKNDLREAISTLRGSSQKLLDMVENILTWARSQTGKIKVQKGVHPLNSIILKTVSYFTQSANSKNIDLKVNFDGQPHCYCDEGLFSTVLRNLINNGIKFTSSGGQIIVSTKMDKANSNAIVIVADTGVGMTEEEVKNLWKVNKASGVGTSGEKGTGLGLILVKESVELNGGTISVESEKGLGTEFVFTVPLAESESKEESPFSI